jgi:hypothetical protein
MTFANVGKISQLSRGTVKNLKTGVIRMMLKINQKTGGNK